MSGGSDRPGSGSALPACTGRRVVLHSEPTEAVDVEAAEVVHAEEQAGALHFEVAEVARVTPEHLLDGGNGQAETGEAIEAR